ncbi:hypothetical protein ACMYR2_1040 [Nitrobacter sp. TKz-YC01]
MRPWFGVAVAGHQSGFSPNSIEARREIPDHAPETPSHGLGD